MPNKRRRLLFVRHAQRLDRYIREAYPAVKSWTNDCFSGPAYRPFNIEFPITLPSQPRNDFYMDDSPITTMGEGCAQILGNRIAEIGLLIDKVYSSPSLRCLQTGFRILEGYSHLNGPHNIKMRLEGGLYEFGQFSPAVPTFLEPKFLSDRGLPIDLKYKNQMRREELLLYSFESYNEFRDRAKICIDKILKSTASFFCTCPNETIMIVTHAPTLLTFVRNLLNKPINEEDLVQFSQPGNILNKPAYIATVMLEEDTASRQWMLPLPQPIASFEIRAHTSFTQSWLDKYVYESPASYKI